MFTIEYVKNLQWADIEHTIIECIVKYKEFNEEHPTGVKSNDEYQHIKELWVKANAGEYGIIAEYEPPLLSETIVAKPDEEQPTTEGTQTL
jgi:hypothetical protein